jgi:hypothetical protein
MVPVFRELVPLMAALHVRTIMTHLPPYLTPEALAYCAVNAVALFLALQLFQRIAQDVFKSERLAAVAVFLFIVAVYVIFILDPSSVKILPYDLPSLAFIQLGTLCLIRHKWLTLLLVFSIATLNRETTFLLVVFFAARWWIYRREEETPAWVGLSLAAIWAAIKLVLWLTITGAGGAPHTIGGIASFEPFNNLMEFLKPWQWPVLLPQLVPFGILAALLTKRLPKGALEWPVTYLIGYAALFQVAGVMEYRSYGDLIGFCAISLLLALQGSLRGAFSESIS